MKTKLLFLSFITLFTLSSYSQTTYTYYVDGTIQTSGTFTGTQTVQPGDIIEFVNSYLNTTQFIAQRDGVNIPGYSPTSGLNVGSVIYSYTVNQFDVNFDLKVGPSGSMFNIIHQWIDFTVDNTTNVENINDVVFSVYPNPTKDILNFKGDEIKSVRVFDMTGRLVLYNSFNTSNVKVDVSFLKNGYYNVLVNDTKSVKFIKE